MDRIMFVDDETAVEPQPVVDPEVFEGSAETTPVPPEAPAEYDITIKVPVSVPEGAVHTAINVGRQVMENAQKGVVTMVFPSSQKQPDGKVVFAIAKIDIQINSQKDIERLVKLAQTITTVNIASRKLSPGNDPIKMAAESVSGEVIKDNQLSDLVAQAKGLGSGIVIAQG